MKRLRHVWETILSPDNLRQAIKDVNLSHRWFHGHQPNACTAWVEETIEDRITELQQILEAGFVQEEPKHRQQWDPNAKKLRDINEPRQWPDQYIHHAMIQAFMPAMMRGMDPYCCGSIKGRGAKKVSDSIRHWMKNDTKGTKYCAVGDIWHCYEQISPEMVMNRFRELICDNRALDLLHRCVKDGIMIGAYHSQWCCNTVLQPLDQLIRQSGLCTHYVRYMDNFTFFGRNKKKLHRLLKLVDEWLQEHGLRLKPDWQVYRTEDARPKKPVHLDPPRRGVQRPKRRLPSAVGYRYGRTYTLPRKHNLFNLKRDLKKFHRCRGHPNYRLAARMLCRIGRLKHCTNFSLYRYLFHGNRILKACKNSVRLKSKEWRLNTWSTFLESRAQRRP